MKNNRLPCAARPPQFSTKSSADAGMTLVELLVVIGLLGMIALGLSGGIRFGTQVWARSLDHSNDLAALHAAQALLRRQLEQTTFLPLAKAAQLKQHGNVRFEGTSRRLFFHAPMVAEPGFGGFHEFELKMDNNELIINWQLAGLYRSDSPPKPRRDLLLTGVRSLAFSYFGTKRRNIVVGTPVAGKWHANWSQKNGLPDLIRLSLERQGPNSLPWPELVVAPKINPGTSGR